MKTVTTIFILLLGFEMLQIHAQEAKLLVKKADDKMQGASNKSEMAMTIVRPTYSRTIEFKNWSLGRDYFITYITAPAKDKGQVFLKVKSELWNFMPAINRMIKLPPAMMSQGWMGSDYSNDDLVKQTSIVNDYTHETIGNEQVEGISCIKIKMVPNADANVVWGKVITWIDPQRFIFMKSEYYDDEDFLIRTEICKNIKTFDGREIPSVIEIIPAEEPKNKTEIEIKSIDFDIEISESFFTQQNMKKIR